MPTTTQKIKRLENDLVWAKEDLEIAEERVEAIESDLQYYIKLRDEGE